MKQRQGGREAAYTCRCPNLTLLCFKTWVHGVYNRQAPQIVLIPASIEDVFLFLPLMTAVGSDSLFEALRKLHQCYQLGPFKLREHFT